MGVGYSVKAAHRALVHELKRQQRDLRRGAARAINRTIITTRTRAKKEITGVLNVKASAVTTRLFKIQRAKAARLEGSLSARYRPLRVIDFKGVRATKKGVSVVMRKDKGRSCFAVPSSPR